MKKSSIILVFLILCVSFSSCNKHQCIEVPQPDQNSYEQSTPESEISNETPIEMSSEDSSEEHPDMMISPDGYIEHKAISYRGEFFDTAEQICLIKDNAALMKFYETAGVAITDSYEKEYFKEKVIIFVLLHRGSGSCMLDVKHVKIDNAILTVTITDRMPDVGTDDEQRRIIAIEISREDVIGINETALIIEDTNVIIAAGKPEPAKTEDFSEQSFGGTLERSDELFMLKNFDWLEIITDRYELDMLAERYTYNGVGENMLDYINNLETDFFDTKAIIALPYTLDTPSSLNPTSPYWLFNIIDYPQEGLTLYFRETMKSFDGEYSINLIIIDRSVLPKNNVYNVIYVFDDVWEIE